MRRREFLRVASGAAAATAAGAGTAAGQETATPSGSPTGTATGNESGTAAQDGGGGGTVEVTLVDFAFEPGTEEPLVIPPGTTVRFVWETDNHNIHVDSKPEGSDWEGHEPIENADFTHEHTFETVGDYHFWCTPHQGLGMVGDITVEEGAQPPGAGAPAGAPEEVDPEEMGVPFQAHFVGIATVLMIIISLVFTFYVLKYGETPHSGYPRR